MILLLNAAQMRQLQNDGLTGNVEAVWSRLWEKLELVVADRLLEIGSQWPAETNSSLELQWYTRSMGGPERFSQKLTQKLVDKMTSLGYRCSLQPGYYATKAEPKAGERLVFCWCAGECKHHEKYELPDSYSSPTS